MITLRSPQILSRSYATDVEKTIKLLKWYKPSKGSKKVKRSKRDGKKHVEMKSNENTKVEAPKNNLGILGILLAINIIMFVLWPEYAHWRDERWSKERAAHAEEVLWPKHAEWIDEHAEE